MKWLEIRATTYGCACRLTASPSGSKGSEAKESAKSNAEDAKQKGKGFLEKTEDKAKVGLAN